MKNQVESLMAFLEEVSKAECMADLMKIELHAPEGLSDVEVNCMEDAAFERLVILEGKAFLN